MLVLGSVLLIVFVALLLAVALFSDRANLRLHQELEQERRRFAAAEERWAEDRTRLLDAALTAAGKQTLPPLRPEEDAAAAGVLSHFVSRPESALELGPVNSE